MQVKFVVGCLPCSEQFFSRYSGFPRPLLKNQHFQNVIPIWPGMVDEGQLYSFHFINNEEGQEKGLICKEYPSGFETFWYNNNCVKKVTELEIMFFQLSATLKIFNYSFSAFSKHHWLTKTPNICSSLCRHISLALLSFKYPLNKDWWREGVKWSHHWPQICQSNE